MDSIIAPLADSAQAIYLTILFGCILTLSVGVGLASANTAALGYLNGINRWVSMRRALKPLMVPHIVEPTVLRSPMILGVLIVLAAGFSLFVLAGIDSEAFQLAFFGDSPDWLGTSLATFMQWFLLIGNAGCLLLGGLMIFAPSLWSRIEAYADRWYSLRKLTYPLDKMHNDLDIWVMAHPTISGIGLIILSLGLGIFVYTQLP